MTVAAEEHIELFPADVAVHTLDSVNLKWWSWGARREVVSGMDKIRRGWESQHWRSPTLLEFSRPDRVKIMLPMISLLPDETLDRLKELFGADFDSLTPLECQALATAVLEGSVSNRRLQRLRAEHPSELSRSLQGLAVRGFLEQLGQKRGTEYRLPNWASRDWSPASPAEPGSPPLAPGSSPLAPGSSPLAPGTPPLALGSPPLAPEDSDITDPVLMEIARPAREKPRLAPQLTKTLIRRLCSGRFLTAGQIGVLLGRAKDKLQEKFLTRMVAEGELVLRFPAKPNHVEQAYTIKET